jgi:hydroxymethylpyrimidine/phosphomethylpyrimidine kinase
MVTGMLASAESIEVVADAFQRFNVTTSVVDPVGLPNIPDSDLADDGNVVTDKSQVMVSTSGSQLLPQNAISTLIKKLLPITTILTPNLPEAKLLLETAGIDVKEPENVDDVVAMAHNILRLGPKWVLLKGGHLPLTRGKVFSREESDRDVVLNVLVGESGLTMLESEYLKSENTHGTGCSLACKSLFHAIERRILTIWSCNRLQPRQRNGHDQGGQVSKLLHRGWDKDER